VHKLICNCEYGCADELLPSQRQPMDLVRLPGPSRRTVVLLLDGPRPTETLESRRGRATRKPRERSSRCVPSTLEVRVLWVERTREKRRVSRLLQSRDVSRPCSASAGRRIFVFICGSRCLCIVQCRSASRCLVQYSSEQKQVVPSTTVKSVRIRTERPGLGGLRYGGRSWKRKRDVCNDEKPFLFIFS